MRSLACVNKTDSSELGLQSRTIEVVICVLVPRRSVLTCPCMAHRLRALYCRNKFVWHVRLERRSCCDSEPSGKQKFYAMSTRFDNMNEEAGLKSSQELSSFHQATVANHQTPALRQFKGLPAYALSREHS